MCVRFVASQQDSPLTRSGGPQLEEALTALKTAAAEIDALHSEASRRHDELSGLQQSSSDQIEDLKHQLQIAQHAAKMREVELESQKEEINVSLSKSEARVAELLLEVLKEYQRGMQLEKQLVVAAEREYALSVEVATLKESCEEAARMNKHAGLRRRDPTPPLQANAVPGQHRLTSDRSEQVEQVRQLRSQLLVAQSEIHSLSFKANAAERETELLKEALRKATAGQEAAMPSAIPSAKMMLSWVNSRVAGSKASSIADLRDGTVLLGLLEGLGAEHGSPNKVGSYARTPTQSQWTENCQTALDFIEQEGIGLGSISSSDIASGDEDKTLQLLFQLIQRYHLGVAGNAMAVYGTARRCTDSTAFHGTAGEPRGRGTRRGVWRRSSGGSERKRERTHYETAHWKGPRTAHANKQTSARAVPLSAPRRFRLQCAALKASHRACAGAPSSSRR